MGREDVEHLIGSEQTTSRNGTKRSVQLDYICTRPKLLETNDEICVGCLRTPWMPTHPMNEMMTFSKYTDCWILAPP